MMTETQARAFRAAYEAAVKRYAKMTKAALAREEAALMADQGMERLYGGPFSKDEYLSSVLNLRGYTIEKLNETVHILYHQPVSVTNSACGWCQCQVTWRYREAGRSLEFLAQCTGQPGHDGRHQDREHPEADAASPALPFVPSGTGWPVP